VSERKYQTGGIWCYYTKEISASTQQFCILGSKRYIETKKFRKINFVPSIFLISLGKIAFSPLKIQKIDEKKYFF